MSYLILESIEIAFTAYRILFAQPLWQLFVPAMTMMKLPIGLKSHLDWLQSIGLCGEGAPSHDTYERFFRHLDSKQFQACFIK